MKRRLALLVGTFVVLLLGYFGYYFGSSEPRQQRRRFVAPTLPAAGQGVPVPGRRTWIEPGKGLRIIQYDTHHRLQAKYFAEFWDKVGDRFRLKAPYAEWYLRGGEVVTISARDGIVRAKEVGKRWNVIEGDLVGDVEIVLDRSRDPLRQPLAQRPADAVRIRVDEVRFDREALLIESDSYVSVFAYDADILGRGLRISWSTGPQQLRQVKIIHGEYMCVRRGQEQYLRDLSLPGSAAPSPAPATAPVTEGQSGIGGGPRLPGALGSAVGGILPAALGAATTRPATATATAPATTTAPATATAPAPPPIVPDNYAAILTGDVVVTSGRRYLRGAEELTLIFEFQPPRRRRTVPSAPSSAPATGPATAMAPTDGAGDAEPLFVTWSGPLVVKPVRSHEPPVPKRLDVAARGARLELADGKTTARCRAFEFESRAQRGRLVGTDQRPVQLHMTNGETLRAGSIDFDRRKGTVKLTGAGEMSVPGDRASAFSGGEVAAGAGKGELTVQWSRDVDILLGRRQGARGPDDDQEYLLRATFNGNVIARRGADQSLEAGKLVVPFHPPTAAADPVNRPAEMRATGGVRLTDAKTGDFIQARELDVKMSSPAEGEPYPKTAVARGKVTARQQKMEIAAGELKIDFAAEEDRQAKKLKVKPTRLEASGGVEMTDRREADPIVAQGRTVNADLVGRTATLVGKPARLRQKDNEIEGPNIHLDQSREAATVTGPGRLGFSTRADLSGNRTEKPRAVNMQWTEGLKYRGKDLFALATGEVVLETAGDRVECERMRVFFAPPERHAKPDKPEPDKTKPDKTEPDKAEPDKTEPDKTEPDKTEPDKTEPDKTVPFRPKRIAVVLAEKKVRLASERHDEDGFLTQRLTLWSEKGQVSFEVVAEKVTCTGPGTLVVSDYRPPEQAPDETRLDPLAGGGVRRPSQSVFDWAKSMDLSQKDRIARLVGTVTMAHRSGGELVLREKLKVRPWGKLPAGRNFRIHCQNMLAEFAPPPAAPAGGKPRPARAGPPVGPLELFHARAGKKDYVQVFNGPIQIVCRRVLYQRSKDVAILYGFLEDEPPRNAVVYHTDKDRGRTTLQESSKIIWHPSNNEFEAKGVKVTGRR